MKRLNRNTPKDLKIALIALIVICVGIMGYLTYDKHFSTPDFEAEANEARPHVKGKWLNDGGTKYMDQDPFEIDDFEIDENKLRIVRDEKVEEFSYKLRAGAAPEGYDKQATIDTEKYLIYLNFEIDYDDSIANVMIMDKTVTDNSKEGSTIIYKFIKDNSQ